MNKLIVILPLFLLSMCSDAPVTPPAGALEVEGGVEQWIYMVEYLKNYQREENMTDPDDAINKALMEYLNGSNGSTEQKELLQLQSDGN